MNLSYRYHYTVIPGVPGNSSVVARTIYIKLNFTPQRPISTAYPNKLSKASMQARPKCPDSLGAALPKAKGKM